MGCRAHYCIIQNGVRYWHESHWGGLAEVPIALSGGPSFAAMKLARASSMDDDGRSAFEEPWCEGGCILDFDKKGVLFFGSERLSYSSLMRRTFLQLVAPMWIEWKVEWAENGSFDLSQYVRDGSRTDGGNPSQVQDPTHEKPRSTWGRIAKFMSLWSRDRQARSSADSYGALTTPHRLAKLVCWLTAAELPPFSRPCLRHWIELQLQPLETRVAEEKRLASEMSSLGADSDLLPLLLRSMRISFPPQDWATVDLLEHEAEIIRKRGA